MLGKRLQVCEYKSIALNSLDDLYRHRMRETWAVIHE